MIDPTPDAASLRALADSPRDDGYVLLHKDTVRYLAALLDERDAIERERDEALRLVREMVEKAAAKSLAGYRELGARAAAAENERDALAALLRECREALHEFDCFLIGAGDSREPVLTLLNRIDALDGAKREG